ncbi:type VII secretion protein EccB, partial [Streptomyces sp. NPDC059374]
ALAAHGYDAADNATVPAPLLAALPTGADLDAAAASGVVEPTVTAPRCSPSPERKPGAASAAGDKADTPR